MIEDIEVTQTPYDCGDMATQIFLQRGWINGTTLLELEDTFRHLFISPPAILLPVRVQEADLLTHSVKP
jgi:hypothetical protein